MSRPSWMERGNCVGVDGELFYPEKGRPDASHAAKAICRGCPVRRRCLDFALEHGEEFGVWGGLSAYQRRTLRRAMSLRRAM